METPISIQLSIYLYTYLPIYHLYLSNIYHLSISISIQPSIHFLHLSISINLSMILGYLWNYVEEQFDFQDPFVKSTIQSSLNLTKWKSCEIKIIMYWVSLSKMFSLFFSLSPSLFLNTIYKEIKCWVSV